MGARVVAVDVGPERRQLAKELGAEAVVDPRDGDPVAALRDLTGGEGVDAALDCTGAAEARVAAVRSARTWGRVCFVGEGGTATFEISPDFLRRQLTVHGSWTFSSVIQHECARFVVKRRVPLGRLITHRFRLEQAAEAYRLFDTQTTGKGVFTP
jgi:L-iditol 2-dehydrogenase